VANPTMRIKTRWANFVPEILNFERRRKKYLVNLHPEIYTGK